jgi:hypothetical protein
MWSSYSKNFCFRDCFGEDKVPGDVAAINKLINTKQFNGDKGCFITTGILSVGEIADRLEAHKSEDDGTWQLNFYSGDKSVAEISIWNYKEIQLCFEIEENIQTGEFTIHYCTVKAFKEYQI